MPLYNQFLFPLLILYPSQFGGRLLCPSASTRAIILHAIYPSCVCGAHIISLPNKLNAAIADLQLYSTHMYIYPFNYHRRKVYIYIYRKREITQQHIREGHLTICNSMAIKTCVFSYWWSGTVILYRERMPRRWVRF